jgi:hypothetical protein
MMDNYPLEQPRKISSIFCKNRLLFTKFGCAFWPNIYKICRERGSIYVPLWPYRRWRSLSSGESRADYPHLL